MSTSIVLASGESVALEGHPVAQGGYRILDVRLGELLGYSRPRDIQVLIESHLGDLPGISKRGAVPRLRNAGSLPETYTVDEYELPIVDAYALVMVSEAPNRSAVLAKLREVLERAYEHAAGTPSSTFSDAQLSLIVRITAETTRAQLAAFLGGSTPRRRGKGSLGQLDIFGAFQQSMDAFIGDRQKQQAAADRGLEDRILLAVDRGARSVRKIRGAVRGKNTRISAAIYALVAAGRLERGDDGAFRTVGRA